MASGQRSEPIGFIGAGQMAQALARGIVTAGLLEAGSICASDPSPAARQRFAELLPGSRLLGGNLEVLQSTRIVFLAIKPQHFESFWRELATQLPRPTETLEDHLFISIAAGVTLEQLRQGLHTEKIVRVMPNTPCLIGQGAAGYACGAGVSSQQQQLVQTLLESVGYAFAVPESALDAVTGLSGSGPAYVFELLEGMADGGVLVGLPREIAEQLAVHTVLGAAALVLETGEHPAALKDRVASPGGTTIAGLQVLHEGALRGTIMKAIAAATRRSRELGEN